MVVYFARYISEEEVHLSSLTKAEKTSIDFYQQND